MTVNLDVTKDKLSELEQLKTDTGMLGWSALINNALTLLDWAVRETRSGCIIVALDEKDRTYSEIRLPALENVSSGMDDR